LSTLNTTAQTTPDPRRLSVGMSFDPLDVRVFSLT
jgi:hypothetical protein